MIRFLNSNLVKWGIIKGGIKYCTQSTPWPCIVCNLVMIKKKKRKQTKNNAREVKRRGWEKVKGWKVKVKILLLLSAHAQTSQGCKVLDF